MTPGAVIRRTTPEADSIPIPWPGLTWLWAVILYIPFLIGGILLAHSHAATGSEFHLERVVDDGVRSAVPTALAQAINYGIGPAGALVLLVAMTCWIAFRSARPMAALRFFSIIAVGWNFCQVAKVIVGRERPPVIYSLDPETGHTSFPSGHASFATALAIAVAVHFWDTRYRARVLVWGVGFVALVVASRIYLGVHYPSDVLFAVPMTVAPILIWALIWNAHARRVTPYVDRLHETITRAVRR